MGEFIELIGFLFIIAMVNMIFDAIIDSGKNGFLSKLVGLACFLGGLYLVMDFMIDKLFRNMATVFYMPFF